MALYEDEQGLTDGKMKLDKKEEELFIPFQRNIPSPCPSPRQPLTRCIYQQRDTFHVNFLPSRRRVEKQRGVRHSLTFESCVSDIIEFPCTLHFYSRPHPPLLFLLVLLFGTPKELFKFNFVSL